MESSVQGLEFLDFTGFSEQEVGELKNVLYGGGCRAVTLPWSPQSAHWVGQEVQQAYPTPVPPMVGGVQPPPPPLGHSGPPWVTLPPNVSGEEPVNGGTDEGVDGVQMMRPNVSTALPMYQPIMHPQPSVIVSNVTANVNVHSFQPMSYPFYQNTAEHALAPPDSQTAVPRRPRPTNKIPKRADPQIRRGVDSQGNFTSQHQFSPNAAPYIPAQVSPSYPYYQQAATGIPNPQTLAGSPVYLHASQIPFPSQLVIGTTYPPVTVFSTQPRAIEQQQQQQDVKETVPYPPQPPREAVAVSLPTAVLPVVPPQPHPPAGAVATPPAPAVPVQMPVKEEEEDVQFTNSTTSTVVIENSKINRSSGERGQAESPIHAVTGNKPLVASNSAATKPPFQSNTERKLPPVADDVSVPSVATIVPEPPVVQNKTWASLFGSRPVEDSKPMATVKPTMQNSVEHAVYSNSVAVTSSSCRTTTTSNQSPIVNNISAPRKVTTPVTSTTTNKSLPSPCMAQDPCLHELGNFLVQYQLEHKTAVLQPRGLTNRSNYCYINATLQALLACPPFYNLLKAIARIRGNPNSKGKSFTPIIDSMVKFMNEFEEMNTSANLLKGRREKAQARKEEQSPGGGSGIDVIPGLAFEPTYVYKMLNVIRNETAFPVEGRQEDAEEFMSCLLNGLNDEMLELQKLANNNMSNGEITTNGELYQDQDHDDSEWKEVTNARNRQTVTRRTEVAPTPLSLIFQGQLRSSVQRVGNDSSDRIQPFYTLPLDIEKAQTVKEALEKMVGRDVLEGVTCTKTNQEVEAYQQVTLEQLPLVLLLHLKCFDYKLHTCSKIVKTVEFPIDLKIEQKLMSTVVKTKIKKNAAGNTGKDKSNASNSGKDRQYKLFAVVYHDGKEATKGHYITDVFHVGYGTWVRYDDATVKSVSENQVLHPKSPRVPYLLYYRRQDTINISQNARNKSES